MVELHRANVIKMAEKGEEAPTLLVVPYLDLVIVATRDEQWLRVMEADTTHGSIVLIELVD